jgi:hypothetical protein
MRKELRSTASSDAVVGTTEVDDADRSESGRVTKFGKLERPMPKLLEAGDRVVLTSDTLMDRAGKLGTVKRKYVPAHCTGVWDITIRWDGNSHDTAYPYPTGGLVVAQQENS